LVIWALGTVRHVFESVLDHVSAAALSAPRTKVGNLVVVTMTMQMMRSAVQITEQACRESTFVAVWRLVRVNNGLALVLRVGHLLPTAGFAGCPVIPALVRPGVADIVMMSTVSMSIKSLVITPTTRAE
jgi:hypothetical protein